MKWLLGIPYRFWIRLELRWVNDCIADELDRQARHEATMKMLRTEAAELRWKLHGGRGRSRFGLASLRPHQSRTRQQDYDEASARG